MIQRLYRFTPPLLISFINRTLTKIEEVVDAMFSHAEAEDGATSAEERPKQTESRSRPM
jgi:hypothetical protein